MDESCADDKNGNKAMIRKLNMVEMYFEGWLIKNKNKHKLPGYSIPGPAQKIK